jgi:Protein of unknown function (DUF3306)
MAEGREESLLARWSRRKQAARSGEPEQPSESQPAAAEEEVRPAQTEAPAPEPPPDLPDPESLDAASDFKPFLRPGVPVETHRAALRRLWRLDPFYSRHDGLTDYAEDFSKQPALEGIRTAYRVGRGLLDQLDKAAQTAESQPEASAEPPDPRAPMPEQDTAPAEASQPQRGRRRPLPKRV